MNKLANIVRSAMIGKKQIPGSLKRGDNFCISGLLINHLAPDINIESQSWNGITELVNRYPKYFSEEHYSSGPIYHSHDYIQKYVDDFKQYYQNTGRINLRLLVSINDHSFGNFKPFTFTDFANLFEEIGIEIEELEPDTKYKENDVIAIDNIQLIEDKPIMSNSPFIGSPNINIENMNVNLDPNVMSSLMSKYVSEMLSKQTSKIKTKD